MTMLYRWMSPVSSSRNSVAFVQKILTSLNSTLPKSGQAVSGRVLAGIYRSQSALRRRYQTSRRSYRPLLEPEWLETIAPITCSLQVYALLLIGSYLWYQLRRLLLIGWCWLNVFQYAVLSINSTTLPFF